MNKKSIDLLKQFIEKSVIIPDEYLKQDQFKSKLDLLEKITELIRFYYKYDDNSIPLENFLKTEWGSIEGTLIEMTSFPKDASEYDTRLFLNPSSLQIPLLTYLLLNFKKKHQILGLIHRFIREIQDNLTPYDLEKTGTGVKRIVTNTRFASLSLRDAGLIKSTVREKFSKWELTFMGVIVAAMLYECNWREEPRSSVYCGPSRELSKDLHYVVGIVTDPIRFEGIMRSVCRNSEMGFEVADYISEKLKSSLNRYEQLMFRSDLDKRNWQKRMNEFINELEDSPEIKKFMEIISFKYDMHDFNVRMQYFLLKKSADSDRE